MTLPALPPESEADSLSLKNHLTWPEKRVPIDRHVLKILVLLLVILNRSSDDFITSWHNDPEFD